MSTLASIATSMARHIAARRPPPALPAGIPITVYALVTRVNRHLGGAIYQTLPEAKEGLDDARAAGLTYDGIVELTVTRQVL